MKAMKYLATVVLLFVCVKTISQNNKDYYYYAYATNKSKTILYVTSILNKKVKNRVCFDTFDISIQFKEYLESEYNGSFNCGQESTEFFSHNNSEKKSEITQNRRIRMKKFERIIKITDFEFICN